ncbi:MAG: formyl-CoA transferase [Acidimicrobiales bacterium]
MDEPEGRVEPGSSATAKALAGIRVLDMTHVQSGPSCTQILGWLGADVIKVELPGRGDITRQQLRDLPDVDSLYFTMLNGNKRSITLNMKTPSGQRILSGLVEHSDVLVENFGPGVLDRQGLTWETLQQLNPRLVYASIKGFGPGPFGEAKAYEPIAQAMGGSMSTTGFDDGPPTVTGAQVGDSGTGIHAVAAILAALIQRDSHTGKGQRVLCAMQDSVLNLCRVKLRDQQRLLHGPLPEYPTDSAAGVVPRSGNASGGGHPGAVLQCAPGGPNDYVYMIIQPQMWEPLCIEMGRPDLAVDPRFATAENRVERLAEVFAMIEAWTSGQTKYRVYERCNAIGVPCGPVLDALELLEDPSLRDRNMIASVEHPERGRYYTVGCPLQLSDSPVEYRPSPLLGQHTAEVLEEILGYGPDQIASLRDEGAV